MVTSMFRAGAGTIALAAAMAAGAAFAAGPATTASPAIAAAAGPWEIGLKGTVKKCGLILRIDTQRDGAHEAIIPSGCRHAMPALGLVRGWTLGANGGIQFEGRANEPALTFAVVEGKLVAEAPDGASYELAPTGSQKLDQIVAAQAATATPAPAAKAPPKPPEAPDTTPVARFPGRMSDLGGRYVILREGAAGGKDIGCMLTLDDHARGPGGYRAQLAPACRDNGIVVFDPVGWNFDRGRLELTARKGHHATFDYHADGGWWKDPKEGGKPLGLRHF